MENSKPEFVRLIPILFVKDIESETEFYMSLGFEISYQGDEFPGLVALRNGGVEFGLEERANVDASKVNDSFSWQMEADNLNKIIAICQARNIKHSKPRQYWEERDAWEMQVHTPNGYTLNIETLGHEQ